MRERSLIGFAALVSFGAAVAGTFVYDDLALLNNPAITNPSGWLDCWRFPQTRPLTWFSFWISDRFGENPIGWHVVSLLLHIAVAALVWDVLRRLIPQRAALIAALIFAVHPIAAEPVVYVYARATLLGALFSLLAIRSWITQRPWLAVVCFSAAMLAKEEFAALPLFLVLFDFSRQEKVRWRPVIAMLAIALILGIRVVRATFVVPGADAGAQAGISLGAYLLAQGSSIVLYLRQLVLPWGLSPLYDSVRPQVAVGLAAWAGVVALMAAACFRFRKLQPGFWFLAGLLLLAPSSSIFPSTELAADRRMYLPLVAFAACAGLLLQRVNARILIVGIVCLMAVSIRYTILWDSPEKLWREAMRIAPHRVQPRIQLARLLPPDQALEVLKDAEQIAPDAPAIPTERGRILLAQGRPIDALQAFGRELALAPNSAMGFNNRGAALMVLGQKDAARADFERALARDPCLFDARFNLAEMGERTPGAPGCRYSVRQKSMLDR